MTKALSATLRALAFLAVLALALAAPARANDAAPWLNWQTKLQADHALTGKIWSVRDKAFITPDRLAEEIAKAKYILIGETHDNADHHRLQAWLIDKVASARKIAVVMEMINGDQAAKLDAYMARPDADAAGLGAAVGWAKRGWPDWAIYQPVAEAAFRAKAPILAGDPKRASIRSVARKGFESLDADERERLGLNRPLPPKLTEALGEDIKESHCDLLPEKSVAPMTKVQRYRDAGLAGAVAGAADDRAVILIAGNGHARNDRGVPWYLAGKAPEAEIATVMLLEIGDDAKTIEDVAITAPDGQPAADYLWMTPRAEREDQCEKLRKHFAK